MLDTIFVDQSLRALAFVRQGDALATRVARDTVAIALADAHYPVTLISPDGTPERLQRHRLADASTQRARPYDALIEKLREVEDSNSDAAWLERELEIAVRLRSTITVTVSLSGADERTFTLEASGIGGGRLRGLDRAADVERTLPLSHITTISLVN